MMTREESRDVISHENLETPRHILFLSGILYVDQKHWTIWINEQPHTPTDSRKDLKVKSVTSEFVTIVHNRKTHTLRANQTINLNTGATFPGDKRRDFCIDFDEDDGDQ